MSIELPDDHAEALAGERERMLGQLRYLIEEARALGPLLERLPADVLDMRPPDAFSTKETLGLLADCDRQIFLPRLHRIIAEDRPQLERLDEEVLVEEAAWAEASLDDILSTVQENRKEVVSFLENLPPEEWAREGVLPDEETQNIYELALFIGQHDVQYLRQLGQMMHDTNLTEGQDLPK